MFCYQCEQTVNGKSCNSSGACGKNSMTAHEQDILTCSIISLSKAVLYTQKANDETIDLIVDSLFTTVTNVCFDAEKISDLSKCVESELNELNGEVAITPDELFNGDENTVSLRSILLFGLRGMSSYAHHARVLGMRDLEVDSWFVKGLASLAEDHTVEEWLSLLMEFGGINLKCMALLDKANTETYGNPTPVSVPLMVEKGPFIVISGHDLRDLKMLLEQTDGKGINVYTHGETLPAHGYPELKKHPQLKGNFGTAWQNQHREFNNIPAPILFTTNCLMPPNTSYTDRVYTTSVVAFPGVKHIHEDENGNKDFGEIINHAIMLGGYSENHQMAGLNGGTTVTTGYGRQTILNNASAIINAVKSGAIKHFYLVGGCDGVNSARNYYTDFVMQSPSDSIILTLACGKYRFNDLDIGSIGSFPRILDIGQCNDAYGAIQVAVALANAFECGVNDLPLTLVLSWYEQKAVCILLTLLSMGIKNILIGPSVPAFFSLTVLSVLCEKFNLRLISTPEKDM